MRGAAVKSQRTLSVDEDRQQKLNQLANKTMAKKFDFSNIFASIAPEDVLTTDDKGVIQIDPNNPKHVEIRDRWLED